MISYRTTCCAWLQTWKQLNDAQQCVENKVEQLGIIDELRERMKRKATMSENEGGMVSVPRWALEFIMANANLSDEGPSGEGWPSAEMEKARDAITRSLETRA